MLADKLLAIILISLTVFLTSCGATDSGHADAQSANTTSTGGGNNNGDDTEARPTIIEQPASADTYEGEQVSIAVVADGTELTYQWQKAVNNQWVTLRYETSATLSFSYPTLADTGLYRVLVSNGSATTESLAAEIIVLQEPVISQDPINQRSTAGGGANFSVSVDGAGPFNYQWYKGFTRLNDNSKYQGTNASELNISTLSSTDQGFYKVVVSNQDGYELHSNVAYLTVVLPVAISGSVADLTLVKGSSGKLSVSATGTAPITYRWQKLISGSWTTVRDATSNPDLTFSNASEQASGQYRAVVNNEARMVQVSNVVTVSVKENVSISNQPYNQYGGELRAVLGDDVNFTVSASGSDVTYSWYKNNSAISSNSTLQLRDIDLDDTGVYRCKVTNSLGTEWCNSVELVILTPPTKTSQSGNVTLFEGENTTLSVDFSGSPVPSVQWYKDGVALSGQTGKTIPFNSIDLDDEGTYTCRIRNEAGSVSCSPIEVVVKEIVRIGRSPSNQVSSPGEDITLSVEATGEPPLYYEWYKNSARIDSGNNLSSITLSDVTGNDSGSYRVVVSNEGSDASSSSAQITVLAPEVRRSVNLQWAIPSQRADGTTLSRSSIGGYRVYHSQSRELSTFEEVANLQGAYSNSVTINNLGTGDHYFVITTLDSGNSESEYSGMAFVRISE